MKKYYLFYLAASLFFIVISAKKAQAQKPLDVGDKIPLFSLMDQDGKTINIGDYIGKKTLVLYFYPKDEGMVCTKEACAFRDRFNAFTKAGAVVIGINGGTVASHKEFRDQHKLPFTLLSDPDNKVYHRFGVKDVMFTTERKTFVVDKNGIVTFCYEALLQGTAHADDALKYIQSRATK